MAFSLAGLAPLAGLTQGYQQGQDWRQQQAMNNLLLQRGALQNQQLQQEQQVLPTIYAAAQQLGSLQGLQGLQNPPSISPPDQPTSVPGTPDPSSGGMTAPPLPQPQSMNPVPPIMMAPNAAQPPPAMPGPTPFSDVPVTPSLAPIYQRESGMNPRAQNPTSTASGLGQDINSTWAEAMRGLGYGGQYPTAKSAPVGVQNAANIWLQAKYGNKPWASSEPRGGAGGSGAGAQVYQAFGGQQADAASKPIAAATAQIVPPQMQGMAQIGQLAQLIERTAPPGTPANVKAMALFQLNQMLAPDQKQLMAMQLQLFKDQMRLETDTAITQMRAQAPPTSYQQGRLDIEGQRLADQEAKDAAGGGQKFEASKPFDVVDDKGKVVRTVMARERRDKAGFVDSETGQDIALKPGEHLKQITPSTAGGGRAGAQVLRQEIGGREVLSDLQNVGRLQVGSTTGMLGGYQPGTSLVGALHGDLARQITSQDAQLMQASLASMTRELSILMSPVYGGNYAAQQIEPLIPKTGDTLGTVMFKIARLAQSADNALEAVSKSPILSNEQQEYATDLRKQIIQAIPWTPQQAQEFAQGGGPQESFQDFVKAGKLQTGGGQADTAHPDVQQGGVTFRWKDGGYKPVQ